MLAELKFVQGAVAKKDFVPALTHFRIANGRVLGFNGQLAISCPLDVDFDCNPRAAELVKAIASCDETIALHMSKSGKLVIRAGNFCAHIECDATEKFPEIKPEGRIVNLNESLLPALVCLEPFIAEDASRPWACGILFDGATAFATNNIVLTQYWLGFEFPGRVNIPGSAVRELVRVGENPERMQVQPNRVTFHYKDGRWISTGLFEPQWPDTAELLDRHLNVPVVDASPDLWAAVERVLPFVDDLQRLHFKGDHLSTVADSDVSGTSVVVECPAVGIYNAKQLHAIRDVARKIGFEAYPAPVPFFGERTRGIIVGIKPS